MLQSSQAVTPANPQTPPIGRRAGGTDPAARFNPPAARNIDSILAPGTGEVQHNYATDQPAPGDLWFRWAYGSPIAAKNADPRVQVMRYNEDTYVLRQNICVHWEGSFTYLLFGNRGALLIDTGATTEADWYPLRKTVDALITCWQQIRRKPAVPLTVALTSGEDIAQNAGRAQFAGRPLTTLVPQQIADMKGFYRFAADWPAGQGQIDLGDRIVNVLPTPGTHRDGVSFYDRYTGLLCTGDLLYPGKIQIANERDFVASLERLQQWKARHPVKWVLGGHIEMQILPGKAYGRFATYKPFEQVLQMQPAQIDEALEHARELNGKQTVLVRPQFWLLNGVGPDARGPLPADIPNINAPRIF